MSTEMSKITKMDTVALAADTVTSWPAKTSPANSSTITHVVPTSTRTYGAHVSGDVTFMFRRNVASSCPLSLNGSLLFTAPSASTSVYSSIRIKWMCYTGVGLYMALTYGSSGDGPVINNFHNTVINTATTNLSFSLSNVAIDIDCVAFGTGHAF